MLQHPKKVVALTVVLLAGALAGCGGGGSGGGSGGPGAPAASVTWVRHWNELAVDASGLDHTAVLPGEERVFGEQYGPTRASRAVAITQIAVFEAVNAIAGSYPSYIGLPRATGAAATKAAVAQAAHDTLTELFPSQARALGEQLAADLAELPDDDARAAGIDLGRRAAAGTLELRRNDGSEHTEPLLGVDWFTSDEPGRWRQDPISLAPLALGGHWGEVRPFVMESAAQFRIPPPPALDSAEYAAAYEEVKRLGGDGVITPTARTEEQTFVGVFWAYDGTPSLCAPPRLYNQIALAVAEQQGTTDIVELARLLAVLNVALADTGIGVWESKYYYDFWRPVTGIREADEGSGPTGKGDGNPATVADPDFTPLGAPASNTGGPDFSPPFPAYPSGHAGFGGALFEVLRRFYGDVAFSIVSDEFNGETRDRHGNPRPRVERHFASFSEAEEENGQSRIYLGIHWSFDKTEGIAQGRRIADHVLRNLYPPTS